VQTVDLEYSLPQELIAQAPLDERDASRLLYLDRSRDKIAHHTIRDLPTLLEPSLIVLNDTKVIPARLFGRKPTGGLVELLLVERVSESGCSETWRALIRSSKGLRPGVCIDVADGDLTILVERREASGQFLVCLKAERPIEEVLSRRGAIPLPPYIRREPNQEDADRYQTIYAKNAGAVAAPTAGLHISERLMADLKKRGHEFAYLTLHVGPGTFTPVRAESLTEHIMHSERFIVPTATVEAIERAKRTGRQVLAVGTTVVRALESLFGLEKESRAGMRETAIFIYPPYRFQVVDAMLTNFHLPRSTLLALVMAFASPEMIRKSYEAAIEARYRFFSYGDAMLIQGIKQELS
jgi:S-adenosylmethionine:tRNA ribosyltransferase-isomerase